MATNHIMLKCIFADTSGLKTPRCVTRYSVLAFGKDSFDEIHDLRNRVIEIGELEVMYANDKYIVNCTYITPPELVVPGSTKEANTFALASFGSNLPEVNKNNIEIMKNIQNLYFEKLKYDFMGRNINKI